MSNIEQYPGRAGNIIAFSSPDVVCSRSAFKSGSIEITHNARAQFYRSQKCKNGKHKDSCDRRNRGHRSDCRQDTFRNEGASASVGSRRGCSRITTERRRRRSSAGRPNRFCKEKGVLPLAFGDARYAPIAGEDLGRVIAAILSDPAEHAGKSYPLYGLRELSEYEVADILTEVLGKRVTYVPMENEAFKEMLKGMGFTPHFQQHMGHVAEDCVDGVFSGMNDLVEQLSGRKPLDMRDYIVKNETLFSSNVPAFV